MKTHMPPSRMKTERNRFSTYTLLSPISVRRGEVLTPCHRVEVRRVSRLSRRMVCKVWDKDWACGGKPFFFRIVQIKEASDKSVEGEEREWSGLTRRAFNQWAVENED